MNTFFSFGRLAALLAKEFIQMRRDRITFAMMLGVPLMQLVLFGFAINNDPKGLPAALVTTSNDRFTRAMVSALQVTGYYRFDFVVSSAAEAEHLMAKGDVAFVVTIPSDFSRRVERGDQRVRGRLLVLTASRRRVEVEFVLIDDERDPRRHRGHEPREPPERH